MHCCACINALLEDSLVCLIQIVCDAEKVETEMCKVNAKRPVSFLPSYYKCCRIMPISASR